MDVMCFIIHIINVMINTIIDYLSINRVLALLTAFFMAGGIASMINKNFIIKYFGSNTPKYISYSVAAISGTLLAVCSCTILPLFASIYKRGAGIGPATTFLFSGPAINVLAIFYSAALLGWDIGFLRAVFAVIVSIFIGLSMEMIFRKEEKRRKLNIKADKISDRPLYQTIIFFALQFIMLLVITASPKLFPTLSMPLYDGFLLKHLLFIILGIILAITTKMWFKKEEIKNWLKESFVLLKIVFPLLIIGVAIAGVIKAIIPPSYIANYVGGNSLQANFIASFIGALMYFATLTEVPIIKALMELGMGVGPAMALLLAGPSLSIPTVLTISKILGKTKAVTYLALVVIFSTICGYIAGIILG
ncbi:permease [Methanocaldococcus sp. 10A]